MVLPHYTDLSVLWEEGWVFFFFKFLLFAVSSSSSLLSFIVITRRYWMVLHFLTGEFVFSREGFSFLFLYHHQTALFCRSGLPINISCNGVVPFRLLTIPLHHFQLLSCAFFSFFVFIKIGGPVFNMRSTFGKEHGFVFFFFFLKRGAVFSKEGFVFLEFDPVFPSAIWSFHWVLTSNKTSRKRFSHPTMWDYRLFSGLCFTFGINKRTFCFLKFYS